MIDGWSEFRRASLRGAWDPEALGGGASGAEHLAQGLLDLEPGACLRRLPDRETFLVDLTPDRPRPLDVEGDTHALDPARLADCRLPVVVKRSAGGAWGETLRELLVGLAPRCPGEREAEALAGLAAIGVRVPRAYLWARRGARSLVALEYLAHDKTLRGALEVGERRHLPELAELVARLHASGWYHRDLYLEHLLVLEGRPGPLALIDAGRARRDPLPRLRWLAKDLAALASSSPPGLGFERLRFLVRWRRALAAAGRPVDLRALLPELARREARMRLRTPRHVHLPGDRPLESGPTDG